MSWWMAIPAAMKAAGSVYNYATQPGEEDYLPNKQLGLIKDNIGELKRNMNNRKTFNEIMTPGTQNIGWIQDKAADELQWKSNRGDTSDIVDAQAQMSLQAQTIDLTQKLKDKADIAQKEKDIQTRGEIDAARMQIARMKDAARQQYLANKIGFTDVLGDIGSAAGSAVGLLT